MRGAAPLTVTKVERVESARSHRNRLLAHELDNHSGVMPDERWPRCAAMIKRGHQKTIKGVDLGALASVNDGEMPSISLNGMCPENRRAFVIGLVL